MYQISKKPLKHVGRLNCGETENVEVTSYLHVLVTKEARNENNKVITI
jgi:hypothetical protein